MVNPSRYASPRLLFVVATAVAHAPAQPQYRVVRETTVPALLLSATSPEIVRVSDIDGDGERDFVVCTSPSIRCFSSRRGNLLYETSVQGTRLRLSVFPDLDGDGIDDLAVIDAPSTGLLLSGRDGRTIRPLTIPSSGPIPGFSARPFPAGDLNADGVSEVAVPEASGFVHLHDGATGALYRSIRAPGLGPFGVSLGDVTGDGVSDLLLRDTDQNGRNRVRFVNGATLAFGYENVQANTNDRFADDWILRIPDINGDSIDDWVTTRSGLEAYSGADGSVLWWTPFSVGGPLPVSIPEAVLLGDVDGDGLRDIGFGSTRLSQQLFTIVSAATGTVLHQQTGPDALDYAIVQDGGDADGDGVSEILVAQPPEIPRGARAGVARVLRFEDGNDPIALATSYPLWRAGSQRVFAGLGDVDGDGTPDVLASARNPNAGPGNVSILDGRRGSVIRSHQVPQNVAALSAIGDVNLDGINDYAAGFPSVPSATGIPGAGRVRIYSGLDDAMVWVVNGTASDEHIGEEIERLGDLDGNGRDDLAVGAPSAVSNTGLVRIYSLWPPSVVRTLVGAHVGARFGHAIASLPDVDRDGTPDLAVGSPGAQDAAGATTGRVDLVSGANGQILGTVFGLVAGGEFGKTLALVPDMDGDGRVDLAIGAPETRVNLQTVGRVTFVALPSLQALHTVDGAPGDRLGIALASTRGPNRPQPIVALGAQNGLEGRIDYYHVLERRTIDEVLTGTLFFLDTITVEFVGDLNSDGQGDLAVGGDRAFATSPVGVPLDSYAYGAACSLPANALDLRMHAAGGAPVVGNDAFRLMLGSNRPGSAIWVLGLSLQSWNAVALPLDLSAAGYPGCALEVSGDYTALTRLEAGVNEFPLPVPTKAALVGMEVFAQAFAQTTPFAVGFSGGLQLRIE